MSGRSDLADGTTWVEHATCRGADPDRFLTPATAADTRRALETCSRCPVRQQCLQLGLAQPRGADTGIWGGTTPDDRQRLRTAQHHPERHHHQEPLANAEPQRPAPQQHRPPSPQLPLLLDQHGVHHDDTGRIQVCELLRPPRQMVLLDGRPIARTRTLADARRAAWRALSNNPSPAPTRARTRA